jgi:hypothetical protein
MHPVVCFLQSGIICVRYIALMWCSRNTAARVKVLPQLSLQLVLLSLLQQHKLLLMLHWHGISLDCVCVYPVVCVSSTICGYRYALSFLTGWCSRYYRNTWVKVLPQLSLQLVLLVSLRQKLLLMLH